MKESTATFLRKNVVALAIACTTLLGCNSSSTTEPVETSSKKANKETEAERCRKKLAAAIRRLEPEVIALQDNPERSINSLNSWIASCGKEQVEKLALSDEATAMIGDSARANARRFAANDAFYIRDCLLLRDLTNAIYTRLEKDKSETSDAARVQAVFDWTARHLSLLNKDEQRVPLSLFDLLMTGRGTVEDRAWLMAEAMRQQQIDVVVVQSDAEPKAGTSLDSAKLLVVVLLEDESQLFDPHRGLPVFTDKDANILNAKMASLAALKAHERWKDSLVEIVAQRAAFSPRMLVLQEQLTAQDSAVLFEELTGGVSEILPIVERIADATDKAWTGNRIEIWDYPEQQVVAASSLAEDQQQSYRNLMRPFDAPFLKTNYEPETTEELTTVPEEINEQERYELIQSRLLAEYSRMLQSSEELYGKPSRGLLKTRVTQLLGRTDTNVIQQLQQVRISSMQKAIKVTLPDAVRQPGAPAVMEIPLPELIRELNESSTGDSLYWTALCQIEREEYGTAINTLMNYRRQYENGKWTFPSLLQQGLCLAAQGRKADAVELLKTADKDDNPERQRVQMLISSLEK